MLRAIRFPDGVTTNLFDPCCGCGKALRQLAQGNNCYVGNKLHPLDVLYNQFPQIQKNILNG